MEPDVIASIISDSVNRMERDTPPEDRCSFSEVVVVRVELTVSFSSEKSIKVEN